MVKVLKNEDLNEKLLNTKWQRKTYPLKLNLTDIQQIRLDIMAYEFKKIVNGVIETILNNIYPKFVLNGIDKNEKKKCPLCKANKKLNYILEDFKIEIYGKDYRRVIYKKGERTKVCNCFEGNTSPNHRIIRMFMLPTRDRTPLPQNDVTQFGKSEIKTVYDSAIQKAMECIKSQVQIKEKLKWKINMLRERILNNQIEINSKRGSNYEKYGEKILKKFIRSDEKMIDKLKKRFAEKIEYKYEVIRLYDTTYSLIKDNGDYYIKIKDFVKNKWMTIEFYGKNYQKKLAEKFIKSKNAETEIIKKGGSFYLQYIYRKELKVPKPNKTFTAVGIDVNIINLASYTCMDKKLKNFNTMFFSGRDMRSKRKRFNEMRTIWYGKMKYKEKGGKGRSKKWRKKKVDSQNERDYVKYRIHHLTTNIIHNIKDTIKKPVIVLEGLKNIRDRIGKELKITKCSIEKLGKNQQKSIRGDKLLNRELNNWNFDDFQKFIEYKANWLGIPVVYVSAKDTSIKCNKCGHIEEGNYINYHTVSFKCKKCGYECNSDFNASVNIAKGFFEEFKKQ